MRLLTSHFYYFFDSCAAQKVAGPVARICGGRPAEDGVICPDGSISVVPTLTVGLVRRRPTRSVTSLWLLDESMDADATASNKASKKTKNDVIALQLAKWGSPGGFLSEDLQEENEISSEGSGVFDQSATFKGTMTAQVVEVYPNGNLLIRGEKIVNFSTGSEVIQVKGNHSAR